LWVFDEPTVTHGYNWGVDKRKPSAHRHHRVAKFTTYTKGTRAIRHTTFVTLGIDAHLWYGRISGRLVANWDRASQLCPQGSLV
jgi:hypothetical protein